MIESLNLVVLEDDEGLNSLICRRLKREGHEVVGFYNAADAVKYLSTHTPHLLITDMNLPDCSGEQIIILLSNNGIKVPYIVITGEGSETLAVKMLKAGAKDYLVKDSKLLDLLPTTIERIWNEVQLGSLLNKAREKIHIQNATLSAINELSPDGILAVDKYNNILILNKTLSNVIGVDESYGFDDATEFFNFFAEKLDAPKSFMLKISSVSEEYEGTLFEKLNVGDRYFDIATVPMKNVALTEINGRIWYFLDVTRHKLASEALENATKMKSQFFAVVSHDVKTPLNSIVGFTGLLEESGLTEAQQEYVNAIKSSGDHLLKLINDILDFTRIEHNAVEINVDKVSIHSMLYECIYNFKPQAETKGIELVLDINDDVPEIIETDPLRIKQVIFNLMGNALKFTSEGKVKLSAEYQDSVLYIAVSDTGIGIEKNAQKNLFSPFTQADATVVQNYGGTGLGLAISKELARLLGGDLTLESELGVGTTFKLEIPAESVDEV
jgi:signal transduction histidine kinase